MQAVIALLIGLDVIWPCRRRPRSAGAMMGDPLIVGIIRDPRRKNYEDRRATFLIAWYVDTKWLR